MKKVFDLKYQKAFMDIFLNLMATGLSLVILQVLIYPLIAQQLSTEAYGKMQTIVSIVYLFGATFGQAISTTRLVKQDTYVQKKLEGDFNLLMYISLFVAVTISFFVYSICFGIQDVIALFLTMIFVILITWQSYLEVGFRLELNYKRVLSCRLLACVGYGIGYAFFYFTDRWQFVFIFSYLLQLLYCMKKTNLLKESIKTTEFFRSTALSSLALDVASFLSKSLTYFDKLILYPLLGGEAVSVYFTANLMGKLVLMVLEPINNVFLSYMSKKSKVSKQLWVTALFVGFVVCFLAYFICVLVSKPILQLFYPQWSDGAMSLIPITTLTLCVSALTSILYPFSLKIIAIPFQCLINGICLIVYIVASIVLVNQYGLFGSCISLLIAYAIKLIIMIGLCFRSVKE